MNLIKTFTLTALLAGSVCLISCDDDDKKAPDLIQQAFNVKYPNATVHEWEYKNGYSVADFINNGREAEAWFDAQGQWYMTETDYGRDLSQLPQVVQQAFQSSLYASWYLEDIDMLEYPTQATVYVFDLEQGEMDYMLRITADGTVLDSSGNGGQGTQGNIPEGTLKAFAAMFPNVSDVDWEVQGNGYYEATFYQDKSKVEAWFKNDEWVMTETGMTYNTLPSAVRNAFENSNFANIQIDDIKKIERKTSQTLYVFDLNNSDIDLQFTEDGILFENNGGNSSDDTTVENPYLPDNTPEGGQSGNTIASAIEKLYPNASIVDIDREYNRIEVDIVHEQIGKEVVFDTALNWQYTKWDIWSQNLPTTIQQYVQNTYSNGRIDDAEYYELSGGNYYEVEIEQRGDRDVTLWFDTNGNVVNNPFLNL